MPSTPGPLPQSTALAEATPDSISELLSRDPEGYQRQDRDNIIAALREQRVRWEAAEAAKPVRQPRAGAGAPALQRKIGVSMADLGL